ncbi:MAG: hypothetical protein ACUVT3_01360 [Ignavibacterium sp.]
MMSDEVLSFQKISLRISQNIFADAFSVEVLSATIEIIYQKVFITLSL